MKILYFDRLKRGQRVRITFESGKTVTGSFLELCPDPKGARFKIDTMSDILTLTSAELSAWITLDEAD